MAKLLYLQYENPQKISYLYIIFTGTTKLSWIELHWAAVNCIWRFFMVNMVNLSLCLIVTQWIIFLFFFISPKFAKLFCAIHSNYDMLIAGWWEVGLRNRGIRNIRYHDVSSSGSPICSVGCCWALEWTEIFLHMTTQGNLLGCWLKVCCSDC